MSPSRRLIVNADDFGRSHSINQAVVRAHREGILTTASLMVNGEAADEAVELARQNPRLGVGLHCSVVCGTSALPPGEIPGLVDARGNFGDYPIAAGFRYFFRPELRRQLEREMAAQFEKFRATGLTLDHVNGHLHFHLHPTIFRILMRHAGDWGITHLRLTRDPFGLNLRLASGHLFYRASHALVFSLLAPRARPALRRRGIRHTSAVFGLLQNARVDERYLTRLIPRLPPGDSELYSHPSLDEFKNEFDALISPQGRSLVEEHRVQLIRYRDL
ncbi:MAG TPA: hopanoid biosynthesis-associated protein HpnK [Haliangiales bacterium]|nr:hopanoid biosynthesis-associated protein HpnK [Haliangiales bacterium]